MRNKKPRYGQPLFSIEIDISDLKRHVTSNQELLNLLSNRICDKYNTDISLLDWFEEFSNQINLDDEARIGAPLIIEERLVPLCLKGRRTRGDRNFVAAIYFDQVVTISYYMRKNRRIFKIFEISVSDAEDSTSVSNQDLKLIRDLSLSHLIHFKKGDIIYGLRSWEQMLRTDDSAIQKANDDIAIEVKLQNMILDNLKKIEYFIQLKKFFKWKAVFVGHDVYSQSLIIDACISTGGIGVTLHKHQMSDIISSPVEGSKEFTFDERITETRNRKSFVRRIDNLRYQSIPENQCKYALDTIRSRMESATAFSHIKINRKTYKNFSKWYRKLSLAIDEIGSKFNGDRNFIFYLHSFSDSACHWGVDGIPSHYLYFLNAAKFIFQANPSNRIIIRPHPVSFTYFKQSAVAEFDLSLNIKLIEDIKKITKNVFISQPWISSARLLQRPNSIIVTRWGNIGIESAYSNIPTIISPVAPYAHMIDPRLHVSEISDFPNAIKHASLICDNGTDYNRAETQDIIRYVLASSLNEHFKPIPKSLTRFSANDWWIFDSITDQRRAEQMAACRNEYETSIMQEILDFKDRDHKRNIFSISPIYSILNQLKFN